MYVDMPGFRSLQLTLQVNTFADPFVIEIKWLAPPDTSIALHPHHIAPPHIGSRRSITMGETFRLIAVLCLDLLMDGTRYSAPGGLTSPFSVIGIG